MTRLAYLTLVLVAGPAAAQTREPPAIYLQPIVPPGLKLLTQPAVQAGVGLTEAQKAEVMCLDHLWGLPPRALAAPAVWVTPEMARAAVVQRTQEFVTRGLTKEQRTRLDQIVFQLREKEFGAHAAFAMAAGDLGLRADQLEDVHNLKGQRVEEIVRHVTSGERYEKVRARVAATNGQTFEKMAEMLTRAQRERLKELRGKPFAGDVDLTEAATPGQVRRYPPELLGIYDLELRYLADPSVREELRLTDTQARRLAEARAEWERDFTDQPVVLNWMEKLHAPTEKALAEHLTAAQRIRLDEIMMQRRAKVGPEAMCGHPAAVAALKLSPIQLKQLRDGMAVADVLTRGQLEAKDRLLGKPFELPTGVKDPFLPQPRKAPPADSEGAFARSFLALSNRLRLSEDQIKKLRELAEDEPRIKELIRRELSLSATPPVAGSGRGLTLDRAVMDRYQAAVEEQCWSVLDAPQQSLARKIFGRGGR